MHQGLNEEVESEVRKLPEVEDFPLYENSDNDEFEQMLLEKVETISQRGRKRASINYMDMEEGLPAKKKKISVKRPLQVTLKNPPITGPTVSIDVDDDDE